MNREIKFRAWIIKQKAMYFNHSVSLNLSGEVLFLTPEGEWKEVSEATLILMQYTGLKDKNGKEIYEGDITTEGIIYWNEFMLCWFVKGEKDLMLCIKSESVEIIGNIYENPELLK